MKNIPFSKKPSLLPVAVATLTLFATGLTALAQTEGGHSRVDRVESELRTQLELLKKESEPWAKEVHDRAAFALYKINNAQISSNPSVENMHLRHACDALADERALLIQAQMSEDGASDLVEKLIEQTFTHREILGCGE
ncbi:MAG: hypothetical protein RIR26_1647 [Pseudomonadota bacterium]